MFEISVKQTESVDGGIISYTVDEYASLNALAMGTSLIMVGGVLMALGNVNTGLVVSMLGLGIGYLTYTITSYMYSDYDMLCFGQLNGKLKRVACSLEEAIAWGHIVSF